MANFSFRKYLMTVLLFVPLFAGAQTWWAPLPLTFDADDTLYPHFITIDTGSHLHNSWQVGRPGKTVFTSAYSLPNAIMTDTLNTYPPSDTSVFLLGVRGFYSGPGGWLGIDGISFFYQMDVDTGSRGLIEYSTDTGHTWHTVLLPGTSVPDTVTFTHSTAGWQNYGINISHSYTLDSVILRFTFIADTSTVTHDGWIIDNFYVGYITENVSSAAGKASFRMNPNPVRNVLAISGAEKLGDVVVCNTVGQVVHKSHYRDTKTDIDVRELPPGLYFVQANGVAAGRFLKE